MNMKFDSKAVYGDSDKYIKTKIKSNGDKINTYFQGKKVPKENASYKCFSLIILDSVIKAIKRYYPQTLFWKSVNMKVANFSRDFQAFVLTISSFPNVASQGFQVQNFQLRVSNGGYKYHFGKYIYYVKLQLS